MSVVAWVRHLPDLLVDMAQRLRCAVVAPTSADSAVGRSKSLHWKQCQADSRLADKQDKRLALACRLRGRCGRLAATILPSARTQFEARGARRWIRAAIAQATGQARGATLPALVNTALNQQLILAAHDAGTGTDSGEPRLERRQPTPGSPIKQAQLARRAPCRDPTRVVVADGDCLLLFALVVSL